MVIRKGGWEARKGKREGRKKGRRGGGGQEGEQEGEREGGQEGAKICKIQCIKATCCELKTYPELANGCMQHFHPLLTIICIGRQIAFIYGSCYITSIDSCPQGSGSLPSKLWKWIDIYKVSIADYPNTKQVAPNFLA